VGAGLVAGQNGGFASILTAPGRGRVAQVKTFVLSSPDDHPGMDMPGMEMPAITELASFLPYGSGFRTGVSVSVVSTVVGASLLVAPGVGAAPAFKRFSYDPTPKTFTLVDQFFAFDPRFRGGVTVGGK
jgi:hypothetical protein